MPLSFRVELWCSGECSRRYLMTIATDAIDKIPKIGLDLIRRAERDGWTQDGTAGWCPACTRQVRAEAAALCVRDVKGGGR